MSIGEATGQGVLAETGLEASVCDAGDSKVTSALMMRVTGGDFETAWNVGECEMARDERKRGESQNSVFWHAGHTREGACWWWFWVGRWACVISVKHDLL
jgi:hypothetical protein